MTKFQNKQLWKPGVALFLDKREVQWLNKAFSVSRFWEFCFSS